ncbi:hypothetical protein P3T25_005030, partial [Paraburkholderia sp. GAS32]
MWVRYQDCCSVASSVFYCAWLDDWRGCT